MGGQSLVEDCYGFVCFVPLDANTPKIFGFSEFLASLALMVLAWTIVDIRYRFRIMTAPIPLYKVTFMTMSSIGVLTLLTDLWRAEQWLVPKGNLITPAQWQALLGGLFLLTFLAWAWFAFIKPAQFGSSNAKRYYEALKQIIIKGSPSELPVIADEFKKSVKSIIRHSIERNESTGKDKRAVATHANNVLLLIAHKKFCRTLVESSSDTILEIFQEIERTKKYKVPMNAFAQNIVNVALANKDSFLFHEADEYGSGLIGATKPLSKAIFSKWSKGLKPF